MKKLIVVSSFLLSFLLILSCSKTETNPKTKTDLLVANVWKLTKVTESRSGKSIILFEVGVTPSTPRDDFNKVRLSFLKDGTLNLIDGDNIKSTGTWIFTNNETQIETRRANSTSKYTLYIDVLEERKLNFTEKDGSDAAKYESIPE
jgi:hypothetical protein